MIGLEIFLGDVHTERALTPHDFLRYALCFSFTVNPIFCFNQPPQYDLPACPGTFTETYPGEMRCTVAIANFTGHSGAGGIFTML